MYMYYFLAKRNIFTMLFIGAKQMKLIILYM